MSSESSDMRPSPFKSILGLFLVYYLPVGMIASTVIQIIRISNGRYEGNLPAMLVDISYLLCYCFFGIYTIYAFAKRKGEAVTSAIFTLGLVLFSNIISLLHGGDGNSIFESASRSSTSTIIAAMLMVFLFTSRQVKEVIPVETRKYSKLQVWMMGVTVLLQLVFISMTVVTSAKDQIKSLPTEEKIALYCKQMKADINDDEYDNGIRATDVYPDSGRLVLTYQFETLEKDSISDSQLELTKIVRYETTCSSLVSSGTEDPLIPTLVEGGYDLEYRFFDKDSNYFFTYTIPCLIIASGLQENPKYQTPRETFERAILLTNESLPIHLLNDCRLTSIDLSEDGKTLTYKIVLEGFTPEMILSLPNGYFKSNFRKLLAHFNDTPLYLAKINGQDISFVISAEGVDNWKTSVSFTNDDIK